MRNIQVVECNIQLIISKQRKIMVKLKCLVFTLGLLFGYNSVRCQEVALKSNLIADATTTFNLAAEIGISAKNTLDLYVNYNPWKFGDNKSFKHLMVQPEYRFWFCERFSGSFLGIHAHAGIFNVGGVDMPFGLWHKLKDYRYEGEFIGAGISYGYQWILNKHWNIEANIGAGYAYIHYDKYQCKDCGKRLKKDQNRNYLGPTKAAVSLVYLF